MLVCAAVGGHVAAARALVALGADRGGRYRDRVTAAEHTADKGHAHVVAALQDDPGPPGPPKGT